jgi:alpha-D-xyloside xylohydrolase
MTLLLALLACQPADTDPPDAVADGLSWADGALELRRNDVLLVRVPTDGFQVGVFDALDDTKSYDPYFEDNLDPTWLAATSAEVSGDTVTLTHATGVVTRLVITAIGDDSFRVMWTPDDPTAPIGMMRWRLTVDPTEGFYGLGEHFDRAERRGLSRSMQLEVEGDVESAYNEAHVPVPLLIGTTGWGVLVADDHPQQFDVATEADDLVQFTVGTGFDTADGLRVELYSADHPLDVTSRYWASTGRPRLPGPWALGPLVWRNENRDQAQFEDDLQTMRELDLPVTGMWIDRPYDTYVGAFGFDPVKFPDPQGMIARTHGLGARLGLWSAPVIDPGATENSARAIAEGWFPPQTPPLFNPWSPIIDFTNPVAYAGFQDLIRNYTDMGIEGFKLDYAEDVVVGLLGNRLPWTFFDGSDERTMHREYARLYHKVYDETLPPDGGFELNRAGSWGDQVYTSIIWPGDIDATMAEHRDPAVNPYNGESYVSVGGLPAAVIASQSLGPSGYVFFASDTGGYRNSPPNKETFTRWFEHTAFSAAMQIGTSSSDVAWEGDETNGFDAEMLDWYRTYTRWHLRMWPYLWTYAQELKTGGRPIVRALGLAHPELGVHPTYDYMLGDSLLVAPVVHPGDTTREVTFPEGAWYNLFTGEAAPGGVATVDAPLGEIPVYLRAGGIVPLLRPTIDALAETTSPEQVDSYATDAGELHARVGVGADGAFTLWEGTKLTLSGTTLSSTAGTSFTHGVVWELLGEVGALTLDGAPLAEGDTPGTPGWWTEGGATFVRTGPGDHEVAW